MCQHLRPALTGCNSRAGDTGRQDLSAAQLDGPNERAIQPVTALIESSGCVVCRAVL